MLTFRMRDPFGCRGVSCVKLPAAVAFPTDPRLLERIEQSRLALPPNSVKALRCGRDPVRSEAQAREPVIQPRSARKLEVVRASLTRLPARTQAAAPLPQLVRIEELYLRGSVAAGRR